MNMHRNVLTALALAAILVSVPRSGEAHYNYPWCAQFSDAGSIFSCAFANYAQCLASVSGVGGLCMPNPAVAFGPLTVQPRRSKVRRHLAYR
jgi:hypothetical protein